MHAATIEQHVCTYPACHCPFDAPADPNWCAFGLPKAHQVAQAAPAATTECPGCGVRAPQHLEGCAYAI